ncbi:hypothetical protein N9X49_01640 [Amylibacter sp.]|nr:hypothetical protein [Amylibacter sp.]
MAFMIVFLFCLRADEKVSLWKLLLVLIILYFLGSFTKTLSTSKFDDYSLLFWWDVYIRLITMDFLDSYDNLIKIVDYFPRYVEHTMGSSFLAGILTFVPRVIWELKPISFGWLIGSAWHPDIKGLSLAPSLYGELYGNFGFFGGIIGFHLFGMFASLIDRIKFSQHKALKIYLCWLFFMQLRGDFLLNDVIYLVVIPYLIWVSALKNIFLRRSNEKST